MVTFIPGAPWLQLQPDGEYYDEYYEIFHFAWRHQERWTRADHRDFWASALKLWPTKRGKRESSVHISMWVWVFRRKGLGDGEIAERLGYSLESLRRGGALRMANDFAAYWDEHYKDRYCPPELPCPPPVVWPADIDERPPLDGPFCSIAWDLLGPKDLQVREQVTALGVRAANWSATSRSGPPDLGSAEG